MRDEVRRFGQAGALVLAGLLAACGNQQSVGAANPEVAAPTTAEQALLDRAHHPVGQSFQVKLADRAQVSTLIVMDGHAYLGDDIIGDVVGQAVIGLDGEVIFRLDGSSPLSAQNVGAQGTGITSQGLKWTGATIPYVFDSSATATIRSQFEQAVQIYNSQTVVRWVPRGNQANYVRVKADNGCYSYVGMMSTSFKPNGQELALGSNGCGVGGALHEMGHASGLQHEMIRQDRDQHITVNYGVIDPQWRSQFDIDTSNATNKAFTPYDYHSIMHYRNVNHGGTWEMVSKEGVAPQDIGTNSGYLTDLDKQSFAAIYGNTTPPPPPSTTVCFYEHINYQGASLCASSDSAWIGSSWNDRVSSVKVSGAKLQLFRDINYGGGSVTLTANTADLRGLNFNDAASSYKLVK